MYVHTAPDGLVRRIRGVYGERGETWLQRLPVTVAEFERRWGLRVEPPFPDLSYSYVAPATRANGTAAVLKLGVPEPELANGITTLRLYDGEGAVRLFDADTERGATLLERLSPGTMLSTLPDEEATRVAAGVMQKLWRPLPAGHSLYDLKRWCQSLLRLRPDVEGGTGPIPRDLVARAQGLLAELLASSPEPMLLHGDLHHFNILRAEREPWLAIDPKGIAGDPVFDVTALLYNPIPDIYGWPDIDRILARRIALKSELLGFDRERIRAWAVVHTVLSACWSAEGSASDWRPTIALAERFVRLVL